MDSNECPAQPFLKIISTNKSIHLNIMKAYLWLKNKNNKKQWGIRSKK